jgi:hypothetical protein
MAPLGPEPLTAKGPVNAAVERKRIRSAHLILFAVRYETTNSFPPSVSGTDNAVRQRCRVPAEIPEMRLVEMAAE